MPQDHSNWPGEGEYLPGASSRRFLGVELALASNVLVPRRETELLGSSAIAIIGPMTRAPVVVDMCCGSGNLALAIARHCPRARLWAADLTDETVALAQANVARLSLADRIVVRQGDLFAAFDRDDLTGAVEMVVCNPPYISSSRLDGKSAHLLDNEPREAFDGGPYGISILQRLVRDAVGFLKPGGWLLCEFGEGQERQVTALLSRTRAYEEPSFGFISGKPRVMITRIRAAGPAGAGVHK
ncbi:release factor glutamine methyltransferase [Aquamicrobium terrae]